MEEHSAPPSAKFEPEFYCLSCRLLEWDDQERCCRNFESNVCPLTIRRVLAGMHYRCLVV